MRPKITVVGAGGSALAEQLETADYANVARDIADVSGSGVVVLFEGGDAIFEHVRDSAPNAVVIVAEGPPDAACQATLFPRARIVGADGQEVGELVESILLDRGRVFTCVARCEGERGIEGEFASVPVRLGWGGIKQILEDG